MNVSIKREQSKLVCSVEREKRGMKSNDKVKSSPNISLSSPRFQNEADSFARDMVQYSAEAIAEMLGCSQQIAAQKGFTYEPKLGERLRVGERSSGIPDFPHFIKQ